MVRRATCLALSLALVAAVVGCGDSSSGRTQRRRGVALPTTLVAPLGAGAVSSVGTVAALMAPAITGFSSSSGPDGVVVSISGRNLSRTTAVLFGGVPTRDFEVVSATAVTALVPSCARSGPISVVTPVATATSSTEFRMAGLPPPGQVSVRPGAAGPGETVVIRGQHLGCVNSVLLGVPGRPMRFTIVSESRIDAIVPDEAGSGFVAVWAPNGFARSDGPLNVLPPTIQRVEPASGPPGAAVRLFASSFVGTTRVRIAPFGSVPFTLVGTNEIRLTIPAGAQGRLIIEVLGFAGRPSSTAFTVTPA